MDRAQAEERFKVLVTAYQTLSDIKRRADYDVDQGYSRYTTSAQRHADWDPGRTYGQSASSHDFGDKFNAAEWYAAHYPAPPTARPAATSDHTQGSSWMKTDSAHQRYYIRKQRAQKVKVDLEQDEGSSSSSAETNAPFSQPSQPNNAQSSKTNTNNNAEPKTPEEAARELHRKRMARIMQTKSGGAAPRGGECTVS